MAQKPGTASKTAEAEMGLGRFIELSTHVTKKLPRDLDDALSLYLINNPLFLGAVLDELRDVRPLHLESKYFTLPSEPTPMSDTDVKDWLKADAMSALSRSQHSDLRGVDYGHLYWAETGVQPRMIDLLRHIRASGRINAAAIDLLRYFRRASSACQDWGLKGVTALQPLVVKGRRYTLSYTTGDGKQPWTLLPYDPEKLWPYKHGFLVFDRRKETS